MQIIVYRVEYGRPFQTNCLFVLILHVPVNVGTSLPGLSSGQSVFLIDKTQRPHWW